MISRLLCAGRSEALPGQSEAPESSKLDFRNCAGFSDAGTTVAQFVTAAYMLPSIRVTNKWPQGPISGMIWPNVRPLRKSPCARIPTRQTPACSAGAPCVRGRALISARPHDTNHRRDRNADRALWGYSLDEKDVAQPEHLNLYRQPMRDFNPISRSNAV